MKLQFIGSITALAALAFATSAEAFAAITTQWDDTKLAQDECLERAETALRQVGFKSSGHTQQSRHGYKSNYSIAVRCLTEMHVVFFIVAGPSNDVTPKYMDKVHDQFRF